MSLFQNIYRNLTLKCKHLASRNQSKLVQAKNARLQILISLPRYKKKTNVELTNTENNRSIPDVKSVSYSSPKSQKDAQFNEKFKQQAVDLR